MSALMHPGQKLKPGALVRFEERIERFACGAFQQSNEPGRREHGGHAVRGEVDDVFLCDGEIQFASSSSLRAGFHAPDLNTRKANDKSENRLTDAESAS